MTLRKIWCFIAHSALQFTAVRVYAGVAGECWLMGCTKCGRKWLEHDAPAAPADAH
jgi:hypothetical protein